VTETGNFVSKQHVLYVGWVLGIALRNGVKATGVRDDAGNWTDNIEIELPVDGVTLTVVVPPPPPDWSLATAMGPR